MGDDLHQDKEKAFLLPPWLILKICLFMMTCMRHAEDPFMLIPHQSAFIIIKTLIILEHLLMCKKVLASSVGCGAFSFIFLQLIFCHRNTFKIFLSLLMPAYFSFFLSSICTTSLCICPCTLIGLMIKLVLFTLQESRPTPCRLQPNVHTHQPERKGAGAGRLRPGAPIQ